LDLSRSLDTILQSRRIFGELFYEVLFRRFPKIRLYFDGVDMDRQALVVTMALDSVRHHAAGDYPAVRLYLQHLGSQHHRKGIPADLYPMWCDAMMIALERFLAEDWDEELAAEWRVALNHATHTMVEGYRRPPAV
jgi:hemoglobin-like flavoprotein